MASYFDNVTETPEFGTLAKLAENLVYRLPGCSDLMILKTLREVYRDFVRRSCCLRTTRRILLEEGVRMYPVEPVYGQEVDTIVDVRLDSPRRRAIEFEAVDGDAPCIVIPERFVPNGGEDEYILVTVDELPSLESDKAPKWFIQKHGHSVCDGVMARLAIMANKPWSDPQAAQQYRLSYENAVGAAYLSSLGGGQHGTPAHDDPAASELI